MPIQTNASVHHSPAPWVIDSTERPLFIRDDVGDVLVEFAVLSDFDELKANARLIAAAPELLDAAKAVIRAFGFAPPEGMDLYTEWDTLAMAIAKAEGRQP